MLREEEITFDAHKAKKCSFTTSRPQVWANTIENHLREHTNPYFSSKYKSCDKQYLEYTLYYNGEEDKKVTINIYVKTGVILIQGEHYQYWAEKVFPQLKEHVARHVAREQARYEEARSERRRSNSSHNSSIRDANRGRSKSVGNLTLVGKETDTCEETDAMNADVAECAMAAAADTGGSLWKENAALKSALRKLEKDYEILSEELETVQRKSKMRNMEMERIHPKMCEESLAAAADDDKETAVTSSDCEGHVEARSKLITDSAVKLERHISDMRDRLQCKITEIKSTVCGDSSAGFCKCHLWADLAKIQSHIATVQELISCDIEELKSRVTMIDRAFESIIALSPSSETIKKIEDEHRGVQDNVAGIKRSLDEMRSKMMLAWCDADEDPRRTCITSCH